MTSEPDGVDGAEGPGGREPTSGEGSPATERRGRPLIERLGLVAIALVLGALFALVAVAAFTGGEPFLGVMGAIGALMTLWVAGLTLLRG